MKKNILLTCIILILSYYLSQYFGAFYFSVVGHSGTWIGSEESWNSLIGFPLAYIFFITLLLKSFGAGNKKKWIGWLLAPALLFFVAGDLAHIYLPVLAGVLGWGIGRVVLIFISKSHSQNYN